MTNQLRIPNNKLLQYLITLWRASATICLLLLLIKIELWITGIAVIYVATCEPLEIIFSDAELIRFKRVLNLSINRTDSFKN